MTLPRERAFNYETHRAYPITPERLAEWFTDLDAAEMAQFFNQVARILPSWERPVDFHLAEMTKEPLNIGARTFMKLLGDYSSEGQSK